MDKIYIEAHQGKNKLFYNVIKEKNDLKLKEIDSTIHIDTELPEPIPTVSNDLMLEFSNSAEKQIFQNTGLLVKINDNTGKLYFSMENKQLSTFLSTTLPDPNISNTFNRGISPSYNGAYDSYTWFYDIASLLGLITLRYAGLLYNMGGRQTIISRFQPPTSDTYLNANVGPSSSFGLPRVLKLQDCIYQIIRFKSFVREAYIKAKYRQIQLKIEAGEEEYQKYDEKAIHEEICGMADIFDRKFLFPYNIILNLFDFNFTCPPLTFLSNYTPISIFDTFSIKDYGNSELDIDSLVDALDDLGDAEVIPLWKNTMTLTYGKDFISFVRRELLDCFRDNIYAIDYLKKYGYSGINSKDENGWMDNYYLPPWVETIPITYLGGY